MNLSEFKDWYKKHTAAYPNVSAWFSKLGNKRAAVWNDWFRELSNIGFDDAEAATRQMKAQNFDGYPDKHVSRVREIVTGISSARAAEFSKGCMCKGTGMVEVMNNGTFKTPFGNILKTETVTVLCTCDKGNWMHQKQEECRQRDPLRCQPPMVHFDSSWMVTWEEDNRRKRTGLIVATPEPAKALVSSWDQLPAYQEELYVTREPGDEDF